jgi:hypothetical protein
MSGSRYRLWSRRSVKNRRSSGSCVYQYFISLGKLYIRAYTLCGNYTLYETFLKVYKHASFSYHADDRAACTSTRLVVVWNIDRLIYHSFELRDSCCLVVMNQPFRFPRKPLVKTLSDRHVAVICGLTPQSQRKALESCYRTVSY